MMKIFAKFALIAALALCSTIAFAGEKKSIDLTIYDNVTIAGVKVPAAEYSAILDRDGSAVKFTLMRGGRKIVATDAHFVNLTTFTAPIAVVTGANGRVTEIQVSKLKGSIVFDQNTGALGGK